MGCLEEKRKGYYVLKVQIGCVTVLKALKESDMTVEELLKEENPNGFYLQIPDIKKQ